MNKEMKQLVAILFSMGLVITALAFPCSPAKSPASPAALGSPAK